MNKPELPGHRIWRLTALPSVFEKTAIVLVDGRLGHSTAAEFDTTLRTLTDQGVVRVVLDMAGVTYLNSAGLGVIRSLASELPSRGGQLTVRSPADPARLALDLGGLSHLIHE